MTWVIGSGKTIGKSHLASGTVCQDSADFRLTNDGQHFVLALSDGAGSSKNSEVGSGLFTKRVCSTLAEALNRFSSISDEDLDQVVVEIIQALRAELSQLGDLKDFHANPEVFGSWPTGLNVKEQGLTPMFVGWCKRGR